MKSTFAALWYCQLVSGGILPAWHASNLATDVQTRSLKVNSEDGTDFNGLARDIARLFIERDTLTRSFPNKDALTLPVDVSSQNGPSLDRRVNLAQTVPLPQDPPPIGTEWDESFGDPSDATKRAEVHTAWNEAIRLAGMARDGIQDLRNSLNSQGFAPNEEDKARNFIVEQSQPMTQMFGPDRALLEEVQGVYEKMLNSIPNLQAPDRNGNVLRLALGSSIKKKNGKTPVCGTKADIEDEGLIYAFTNLPDMTDEIPNDLQLRYRFADSMIVFCPAFFQESADAMETDADALNNQRMLDGLRTPGQTIVHEWAHLTWIKGANANGQDETYGYEQCAELVQKPDENNKNVARNNADNWAVLASYQAYNQEPWAPTGKASGCKDVWPRDGQGNYDPPKVN